MPVNADAGLQRHRRPRAHGRLELPALATPSKKIHAAKSRVALLLIVGAFLTRPAGAIVQNISRPAHAVTSVENCRSFSHNTHPLVEPEAVLYFPDSQAVHAMISLLLSREVS